MELEHYNKFRTFYNLNCNSWLSETKKYACNKSDKVTQDFICPDCNKVFNSKHFLYEHKCRLNVENIKSMILAKM